MFYRRCIIVLFLAVAFVFAPTASAQIGTHFRDYDAGHTPVVGGKPAPLQGTILGTDGRPLQGAEVRSEGKGKSSAPITTITGSNGEYLFAGLAPGLYKLSIVAGGAVKFSTNVKMLGEKARIDFDLRPSAGKKIRNYVWVPGRSGSNRAGGWAEVGSAKAGTLNVKRANPEQFQRGSSVIPTGR
jgi:Carboxypeptidase regulatory-like domain